MAADNRNCKPDDSEALFLHLKEQLERVELHEIVNGISNDDLEQHGYMSHKPIEIQRSHHSRKLEKEGVTLQAGVEFLRYPKDTTWSTIAVRDLLHLKPIEPETLIAISDEKYTGKICQGNNIEIRENGDALQLFAKMRGWLIIIGNVLHLFPSDIDHTITLTISDDKMLVSMDCTPSYGNGNKLTVNTIRNGLNKNRIVRGVDIIEIEKTVHTVNQSLQSVKGVIVAEGAPPDHGKDGRVELCFDTSSKEHDFTILSDGRVDYRNSVNILMATEGQLLATLIEPTKGMPGVDVLNNTVPANDGRPAAIVAGKGIKLSQDKTQLFSDRNGCILYNKPVLEIVDSYVVKGDVDYSTGNIHFNGTVIIAGNVLDGFEVKAEGDIVVLKNVEAARLEAGRDIIIRGGVQGKGKGLVCAGRDVFTEYVQNGRLEAQGAIEIGNFAVNSYIATTSQLRLTKKRGTLIGGEAFALRGFDVRTLGSEQGVKTYVEAGTDFLALKKIREMQEVITLMTSNLKKIESTLKTVSAAFKNNPELAVSRKPLVMKALAKRDEINNSLHIIEAKTEELKNRSNFEGACFVKVFETCHSDVTIKIKKLQTSIVKLRTNVQFYEDTSAGRIGCKFY